jgi:SnoaL-like domain
MSKSETTNADEAVVRHYLTALGSGQVVDALNTFSMDARLRDERGRERRGIREIAAAFASEELPMRVDVEELEQEGEAVSVRIRMTFPETREPQVYRSVFRVNRDRIHSLVIDPMPTRSVRRRRASRPF